MGKKNLTLCLAFLLSFFILDGCRKKEETAPASARPAAKEVVGDLHVLSAIPQEDASSPRESEAVVVIFDRPMVPLQELPEGQGSSFLKFSPPFSGKTRWLGTKTLVFSPERRFPLATEIKVAVPAGTTSLEGCSLKKDYPGFDSQRHILA